MPAALEEFGLTDPAPPSFGLNDPAPASFGLSDPPAQGAEPADSPNMAGAKAAWERVNRPFYPLPRTSTAEVQQAFPGISPVGAGLIAGAQQAGAQIVEGIENPIGVATLGLGAAARMGSAAVRLANRAVQGAFGAQMTSEAGKAAGRATVEIEQGDVEGATRDVLSAIAGGVMAGKAGEGAYGKPIWAGKSKVSPDILLTDKALAVKGVKSDATRSESSTAAAASETGPAAPGPETATLTTENVPRGTMEEGVIPDAQKEIQAQKGGEGNVIPQGEPPISQPGASPTHSEGLGVVPPGFQAITDLTQAFKQAWEGIKTAVRTSPNKEDMSAHMDAADSTAMIAGEQGGNRIKLLAPNEADRRAITFIVESGNDPALLPRFLGQVGRNFKAKKAVELAIRDYSRLKPIADEVAAAMDQQVTYEQSNGVDTDFVEGYIKHAYDMDVFMGRGRPVTLAGGSGSTVGSAFRKQRTFATYADAIQAGMKPRSLDAATLVNSRVAAGMKLVNRRQWAKALEFVNDPTSGKPIVTDLIRQPKGTFVAPMGYTPREIVPGVRFAVHEGYGGLFDALQGRSALAEIEWKGIPVGNLALRTAGKIKHGLLAFDTFHASRIIQKSLFLNRSVGWNKGKTLLDYSDFDLAEAVRQNLITPEMARYAILNRPTANLLLKEGLNVGRVQEALYAEGVQHWPVIGKFNKWVFDKVTRGAMLESGIHEFSRVKKENPSLTDTQVARKVAGDLNIYFGNLGRQGIFPSKTAQDAMRLVALAPQWFESMITTEVKGAGQLLKMPVESIKAGQLKTGTLARGVGQGLAAYFVATQLLNLGTRHQFTWQNPEPDHKLDAWIPDVTGKSPGFFISPFSVVAEVTHDFLRYGAKLPNLLDAGAKILSNKSSPFWRSGKIVLTGKDYDGVKILGTWNRIKQAAIALAPTPIPLQSTVRGTDYPGQTQRQLIGSAGFKVEPAPKGEVRYMVEKYKVTSREGFEGYINSVVKEVRKLPEEKQYDAVFEHLANDGIEGRLQKEARSKILMKLNRD